METLLSRIQLKFLVSHYSHSLAPLILLYCKPQSGLNPTPHLLHAALGKNNTTMLTCVTLNLCPQFSRWPSAAARSSPSTLLVHSLCHYPGWRLYTVTSFSRSLTPSSHMTLFPSLWQRWSHQKRTSTDSTTSPCLPLSSLIPSVSLAVTWWPLHAPL